jgi:hypothetical protein
LGAAATLVVLFSIVYAGKVVVDSFNEASADENYRPLPGECGSSIYDHASILGGERETMLCAEGNDVGLEIDRDDNGWLELSADAGATYTGTLVWDGNDSLTTSIDYAGLGGVDLISETNDGFVLSIVYKDDRRIGLTFEVYTTSSNWSTSTLVVPGSSVAEGEHVDLFFPFSEFQVAGGMGADFTSVGAVVLKLDGTVDTAADISFDMLDTRSLGEYGDLPVGTYGTSVLSATHIPRGLRLGDSLDTESTYSSSSNADGDDQENSPDDEDGVLPNYYYESFIGDYAWEAEVTVKGCPAGATCYLHGWIDLDSNGFFTDANEHFIQGGDDDDSGGSNTELSGGYYIAPADNLSGNYYLRFRVCEGENDCDTPDTRDNNVNNGEIEDYRWTLDPTAITLTDITARSSTLYAALGAVALVAVGLMGAVVILRRRRA